MDKITLSFDAYALGKAIVDVQESAKYLESVQDSDADTQTDAFLAYDDARFWLADLLLDAYEK